MGVTWVQLLQKVLRPARKFAVQTKTYQPTLESLEERRVLSYGFGGWGRCVPRFASHEFACHDYDRFERAPRHFAARHFGYGHGYYSSNDFLEATNLNQTQIYAQGATSVDFNNIVVTSPAGNPTITATLTLANTATGTLTAGSGNGETYDTTSGRWTVTATLDKVDAALAAVTFQPAAGNTADTTIAVKIEGDGWSSWGRCGYGRFGRDSVSGTITLDVTTSTTNQAPTATNLTQTQNYTQGAASVALNDIVVSDPDAADTLLANLVLANTATGSLAGSGGTYNATTGTWTTTGSLTTVNAALAAVAFIPTASNTTDTTIAVQIRDAAGTGPNGTITLDVTATNQAPTATNLTQVKSFAATATSVDLDNIVVSDADIGAIITATLTLANAATGSLASTGGGTFNATTGTWMVTGPVATVNAALAELAFAPATGSVADSTISVTIRDDADTGPNGTITLDVI